MEWSVVTWVVNSQLIELYGDHSPGFEGCPGSPGLLVGSETSREKGHYKISPKISKPSSEGKTVIVGKGGVRIFSGAPRVLGPLLQQLCGDAKAQEGLD